MASASASFKKGDPVSWSTSSQGRTAGTVVKKVTGTAHVEGHEAHASARKPQYEVASDKTGRHAIHKPEALTRRRTSDKGGR
jgi:hypothetical protein